MNIDVKSNEQELQASLIDYLRFSRKDIQETLQKQGTKFAFFLSGELKGIAPKRGSIRKERLAALKGGGGVIVRPKIRQRVYAQYGVRSRISDRKLIFGKKGVTVNRGGMNPQALAVKAELNARESSIGFLSVTSRLHIGLGVTAVKSKYGPKISRAELLSTGRNGSLTFTWGADGPMSEEAAEGMLSDEAQSKVAVALKKTTKDILDYVERKKKEHAQKARL